MVKHLDFAICETECFLYIYTSTKHSQSLAVSTQKNMRKFEPSEELISIFIKNGFIEITKRVYPDDYNEIQKKGYNPEKHRRILTLNNKKNSIRFDTSQIKLRYNDGTDEFLKSITVKEIKSIITFFKLHHKSQYSYKVKNKKKIHKLYLEEYEYIKENNLQFETKRNNFIVECFEKITINI